MNNHSRARRGSARFTIQPDKENPPVMLRAPGLALDPLVPEDISVGGFRINSTHRPAPGTAVSFSIRFEIAVMNGCSCQVIWAEKGADETAPWTIGLSVNLTQEQEDALLFHMTKALASGKLKETGI